MDAPGQQHALFRQYPLTGECAISVGSVPVPYHVYDGWALLIGGTARREAVQALLAGEAVQPVLTAEGRALAGLWVCDFTRASLGPHAELQLSIFVTTDGPRAPVAAHPLAALGLLAADPGVAMLCHGRNYVLVDTAGIRRKAKIDADIEKIAVSMALGQIERADVAVLVIDAGIGPAEQDARIAGKIEEAGRALVIALNKSDLVQGEEKKTALRELTKETFHFLEWAPVVNMSAQRGDGVDRLLDVVNQVAKEHRKRIQTSQLNRFFAEVIEEMPPPLHHGHQVRIHYITQGASRPPTFILWANKAEGLSPSYKRFIANRLRQAYGFKGTPLRIFVKARKDRHDKD